MKHLFFTLLLLTTPAAWAEWEETTLTGKENNAHYHDKSSIKGVRGIIRMQTMINYPEEKTLKSGDKFQSMVRIDGYDCKYEKTAQIKVTYFSGPMGTGNTVFAYIVKNSELDWEPFSASSIEETHWKIACGKN